MSPWDASEIDASRELANRGSRRGIPAAAKVLIAIGILGTLIAAYAAYAAFVSRPEWERLRVEHGLKEFALLYHNFYAAHGKASSSLADLESFPSTDTFGIHSRDSEDPRRAPARRATRPPGVHSRDSEYLRLAFAMIRNGRFVIIWDAVLFPDYEENDRWLLGYEPNAATKGGLVMLGGGSVRRMTAAEFNALPKIKTRTDK